MQPQGHVSYEIPKLQLVQSTRSTVYIVKRKYCQSDYKRGGEPQWFWPKSIGN